MTESTKEMIVSRLIDHYRYEQEDCAGDMLAMNSLAELGNDTSIKFEVCSMEDIVHIYAEVMRRVEDDDLYAVKEGERIDM